MGKTLDLGRRIELNPLDAHCADISVALYEREVDGIPQFIVHSYSSTDAAAHRVAFLRQALIEAAGLEPVPAAPPWLRFSCHQRHERALRRVFLDLCKLESDRPLAPKPLKVFDKKANGELAAVGLGGGGYAIEAQAGLERAAPRAQAVARGFNKLCELEPVEDAPARFAFACRRDHHPLVAALFYRAQNVRAATQEQEASAARGVLAAPGKQK